MAEIKKGLVHKNSESKIKDLKELLSEDYKKLTFYQVAKEGKVLSNQGNEEKAKLTFFENVQKYEDLAVPAFTKIKDQCLFLSEFKITDATAAGLENFIAAAKNQKQYQLQSLVIDDCGMTDF